MKSCKFKIFNTNRNEIDDISVSDRDNRNLIANLDSPPQNWDIYVFWTSPLQYSLDLYKLILIVVLMKKYISISTTSNSDEIFK
jgi:hypothetical protein